MNFQGQAVLGEEFSNDPESLTTLVLSPTAPTGDRSRFLIVLKCNEKSFGGQKYLYLQDCTQDDPGSCLNFNFDVPDDELTQNCGFS